MPIPRREIEAGIESLRPTRIDELTHDVTLAVAPGAVRDGLVGRLRGPETKAIVVLGGEDEGSKACRARAPRPLPRVELRGGEDGRIFAAGPPLAVGEGVDAEMQEHRELVTLPLELRARTPRARCSQRQCETRREQGAAQLREEIPTGWERHRYE